MRTTRSIPQPAHTLAPRRGIPILLTLLVWLIPAPCGKAQTVDDLQAELTRTAEELGTARALIATLRERIALLQAEVRELRGDPELEPLADLPADPLACPASLTIELGRRYERDLDHLPKASPRDGFGSAAADWCERMRREIRGRREWLLAITDLERPPGSRDSVASVRVYDEVSLLPLGGYEQIKIPARFVSRLRAEPGARLWLLTVEVSADPRYNPSRATRGAFDEPPFVGPFVESGFTLAWISITSTEFVPTAVQTVPVLTPLPEPPPPGRDR